MPPLKEGSSSDILAFLLKFFDIDKLIYVKLDYNCYTKQFENIIYYCIEIGSAIMDDISMIIIIRYIT